MHYSIGPYAKAYIKCNVPHYYEFINVLFDVSTSRYGIAFKLFVIALLRKNCFVKKL